MDNVVSLDDELEFVGKQAVYYCKLLLFTHSTYRKRHFANNTKLKSKYVTLSFNSMPRVLPKAANKNHGSSVLRRSILCDSSKWHDTCKSQWNVEHIWQLWVAKYGHPFLYSHIFLALSLTNETRSASPERLLVAATVVVDV